MKKLIKGGIVVTEENLFAAEILIEDGVISAIKKPGTFSSNDFETIDVEGKYILPGIIDAHTHYQLQSRGTVTADDFYTGSRSAACGGVTTFIDYVDYPTDGKLVEAVKRRQNEAAGKVVIDYSLHQVLQDYNQVVDQELELIKNLGIASIKLFTTYRSEGYMIEANKLKEALVRLKELNILPTVHAEDDPLIVELEKIYQDRGLTGPDMHPRMRPAISEGLAVEEIGRAAMEVDLPIYIAHVSSSYGLAAIKKLREEGGRIFGETTPHYLLLDEGKLRAENPQRYIMTPPLRTPYDNEILWQGISKEELQVVATDHCAFSLEQKLLSQSCLSIFPGLPGSETLLPLIHHFGVNEGRFDYSQLVRLLAYNPARIFGLYPQKGKVAVGSDADLVIFDADKKVKLTGENLHSAAGYSPFQEITVTGYPVMTMSRGEVIMQDGSVEVKKGHGKFVPGNRSSLFI